MKNLKNIDWKDVGVRALKTFVQAAISIAIAQLSGVDFCDGDVKNVLIGVAISAGAAGISAVWNGILSPLLDSIGGNNGNNGDSDNSEGSDEQ